MAFDKPTRNKLARVVGECRRLLTDDIRGQFQSVYGIQPDGSDFAVEKLTKLDDRGREIAVALRQWLGHLAATETGSDAENREKAFARMANETAFTYLNRLAALRMCEERGHVIECVRRGVESDSFAMYENVARQALGDRGATYRIFLECVFDELAIDLGVLFHRHSPHSLVFPGPPCIEAVLKELNAADLTPLWKEDETIGWVYQFFHTDEERKAMRKKSPAPRNSHELAVRNQFFTPRYVVEFLTDNTLGRTWYEMRRGKTTLVDRAYFVRHEKEVFLPAGVLPQAPAAGQEDLSKEKLLQTEVQIAYRANKDPREIRVLDPACGSGHFLLYAFDLLETIYEEAWHDEQSPPSEATGKTLRADYETEAELRRWIPELILRHNLYGIDIDRRACQIAAIALWLRAQRRFKELGLKPADRPPITKSNIVTAEPMPAEDDLLEEAVRSFRQPILGLLLRTVFEKMKLAGEAGSLLKIEEEIRGPLAEGRRQWEGQSQAARDRKGRKLLFTVDEMESSVKQRQPTLDLSGITDEEFWIEAEPTILAELKKLAAAAMNGKAVERTLFAEDAEQGFAFVDLCRQRYDVVLMNPPFGDASLPSKPYIDEHYGDTKGDVFKAFVEAFQDRLVSNGMLGIISSRSGFFKRDSRDWRDQVVLRFYRPFSVADLGYFVLDAKVETAAYVLRALRPEERDDLIVALLPKVDALIAESGSPFSVARYRGHCTLKRHQAEAELAWLVEKEFLREVIGAYPQYERIWDSKSQTPAPSSPVYPPMFCFRLLMESNKEVLLFDCIRNKCDHRVFVVEPARFADLPYHSFAYWLNGMYRSAFVNLPPFQGDQRSVRQGLATAKDPRFVRTWWEVPASEVCRPTVHPVEAVGPYCVIGDFRWFPFSKGGKFSPFYGEVPHVINWLRHGEELRAFSGSVIRNPDFYFRPGLTYLSRTTVRTCAMPLPRGSVFGHTGPGVFVPNDVLPQALARFNSYVADGFLSVSHGQGVEAMTHRKQYEVGIMQKVPWPQPHDEKIDELVRNAHHAVLVIRSLEETSRFFCGVGVDVDKQLDEAVGLLWEIDLAVAHEYGVDVNDLLLKGVDPVAKKKSCNQDMRKALKLAGGFPDKKMQAHNHISYALGCIFGRWDIRYATGAKTPAALPDPFNPLPICSAGMLVDEDGLPAEAAPEAYPVEIQWNGLLVDDPGLDGNHPKPGDVLRRIDQVLTVLHGERADAVKQNLCETLEVSNLRDYFRSAAQFFERHRKNYRKGGRDAPIYWPIATKSGSYTLWLYYPRLTDQTLYTALVEFVKPKIEEVEKRLVQIDETLPKASAQDASDLREERDAAKCLLEELEEFRDELIRVAALPYKPNLNDGVLITASPLWKLISHNAWRQRLKTCWESLAGGEFDWAHLALSIWPGRVRESAEADLSIAIAHGFASVAELECPEDSAEESLDIEPLDEDNEDEEGDEEE